VTRIALTFIIAIALAAPAGAQTTGDAPGKKPIHFNKKSAVFKKDSGLASALAVEPRMERGLTADAPSKIVEYFMSRPEFSSRLIEENGFGSSVIAKEGEGDGWAFTGHSGARYVFHTEQVGKDIHFARFSYSHAAPLGAGLKISGVGAVVISVSPGKTGKTAAVDYDVYFTEGGETLDKIAVSVSIQMTEITGDLAALAEGFATLCEAAYDDPESVADEMRDADDMFTKKEIDDFESAMGVKRRGKAR
jgi:hypothetical protein